MSEYVALWAEMDLGPKFWDGGGWARDVRSARVYEDTARMGCDVPGVQRVTYYAVDAHVAQALFTTYEMWRHLKDAVTPNPKGEGTKWPTVPSMAAAASMALVVEYAATLHLRETLGWRKPGTEDEGIDWHAVFGRLWAEGMGSEPFRTTSLHVMALAGLAEEPAAYDAKAGILCKCHECKRLYQEQRDMTGILQIIIQCPHCGAEGVLDVEQARKMLEKANSPTEERSNDNGNSSS